jgi:hypothetical protein
MKKIVILSDSVGGSYSWVTLLNALFPECEIEIRTVSADEEGFRSFSFSSLTQNCLTDQCGR